MVVIFAFGVLENSREQFSKTPGRKGKIATVTVIGKITDDTR